MSGERLRPTNWAGNVTYSAARFHSPTSVAELQELVAGSDRIRARGTGHSFNAIADTVGDSVSLAAMPPALSLDTQRRTVTVGAGVRYGELAAYLQAHGFALPNLGSLPHISVGGACATGTHGSGRTNGVLATAVSALEMVTADGSLAHVARERDADELAGSVIGLGSLGIVTTLTLDVVPTFEVRQVVYEDIPDVELDRHFDEILSSAYSVSLFSYWTGDRIDQAWLKYRVEDPVGKWRPEPRWMGGRLADGPRNMAPGMSPANCTPQEGTPGPWNERLAHFRIEFTPSSGDELQSEYFVPRDAARDAWRAIRALRPLVAPVVHNGEIRTVAADDLWVSPAHERDSVAFHFTWLPDTAAVTPVVTAIEAALAPYAARPHWAKLATMPPQDVAALFRRYDDFAALVRRRDPAGKLRNELVDRFFPR
jgi:xylitol oxidase